MGVGPIHPFPAIKKRDVGRKQHQRIFPYRIEGMDAGEIIFVKKEEGIALPAPGNGYGVLVGFPESENIDAEVGEAGR
jgi:hypothetical protein